jgi:hypothetical protein
MSMLWDPSRLPQNLPMILFVACKIRTLINRKRKGLSIIIHYNPWYKMSILFGLASLFIMMDFVIHPNA